MAPRWSSDSRELYYRGAPGLANDALVAVAVPAGAPFRPGPPQTLFRTVGTGTTWDVTPDRQRFLIELTNESSGDATTSSLVMVTNWFDVLRRLAPPSQ